MPTGTLFIVATPIGNLEDISLRAQKTLADADRILCEDTRVTRTLLNAYDIATPTESFHQHSTDAKVSSIVDRLSAGEHIALVTDAGTPGIADPGGVLVEAVASALPDVRIEPIPGPAACIAALSASGFAADTFVFLGWPPHKKGRETWFANLTDEPRVVVFYESVYRVHNALERVASLLPDRKLMVARELTKKFETIYRGTASEALTMLTKEQTKGEFVIVLDRVT